MVRPRIVALLAALPSALGLALPGGVGRLPALGWNSWNAYHCDIDETSFLTAANAMVSKGFKDAGYTYVNIDDCWSVQSGRDNSTHQIIPDPAKFPTGIKGTAQKIHALGLKIGIYSSAGTVTCAGYPASLGYESIDAKTFASWGVDYLKYDNCGAPQNWTDTCNACLPDLLPADEVLANGTCVMDDNTNICPQGYNYSMSNTAERYCRMRDALEAQNRTILYSLCDWGTADVWTWGNSTGQSWRTTNDISPYWSSVTDKININSFLSNYAGFTGHNDPDMLEVGNGNLTEAESRSHFALWALMKAPLIIGTDLTILSQANIDILQNKFLLAFNQDPVYGAPAIPYKWGVNPDWTFNSTNPAEYWYGQSSNGTMVAMMNTLNYTRTMTADFGEIPGFWVGLRYSAYNAWTGETIGCYENLVDMEVEAHDTAVILFTKDCAGA